MTKKKKKTLKSQQHTLTKMVTEKKNTNSTYTKNIPEIPTGIENIQMCIKTISFSIEHLGKFTQQIPLGLFFQYQPITKIKYKNEKQLAKYHFW